LKLALIADSFSSIYSGITIWATEFRSELNPRYFVFSRQREVLACLLFTSAAWRMILSLSASQLSTDWQARYMVKPLLLETLVDPARFTGTCYRAANWIEVGSTQGRGRMDRYTRASGSPKLIFLYPLTKDARRRLARTRDGEHHEPTRNL
jgi:hypothetical protein